MGQRQWWSGVIAAAVSLVVLLAVVAAADDRDAAAEFKSAKTAIQQQLKDRKPENRLAAIKRLEGLPTLESGKLLFFQGLSSTDQAVQAAAFDALATLSSEKEIGGFLKTTVTKQWKGKPQSETYAGLAILLASESAELQDHAKELVNDAARRPHQGRILLISLVDELAKRRGDSVARSLTQLCELPLFEKDFAFRRAAVQALTHVRSKAAVARLVELLPAMKGEVRSDIVRYLTDLSDQQLGIDSTAWSEWWAKAQESFEFPPEEKPPENAPRGVLAQPRPKQPAAGPSYYGLPLSGAKIVFVLDTSGSMNGPRIVAAKRELVRAISELSADVAFNLIAFNERPVPWQAKLLPASMENKQNAAYFIEAQGLGPKTASYDALEAALSFDAEAIYFLTDGNPFGGKIQNPPEIVRTISQLNRYRRMTISSIGIGVGQAGNNFEKFLTTLAEQNWGDYQRVDQ